MRRIFKRNLLFPAMMVLLVNCSKKVDVFSTPVQDESVLLLQTIETYGLKGDGSDETKTLQKAIDAHEGKTLVLPAGTFFVGTINIISNITIIGKNTKLRNIQGKGIDNIMINLKGLRNVNISGLEIALNGIQGSIWAGTSAMQLKDCYNVHIHNCFIHDNTYVGIRLIGGNSHININHNYIENTDTGVHANNENDDVNIISNIINKGTSEGITVYGYKEDKLPHNFVIDSNMIFNKASFGINIPYAKNIKIEHNTIENCDGGITLYDAVSTGKHGCYSTDIMINSNAINNTRFGIIYVGDRTVVSNNRLNNIKEDGININNFPDENVITKDVTVNNNIIISPALANGGRGGISMKNLVNSTINNNTIDKCGKGFAIRFDGKCENINITANNCGDGMVQSTNTVFDKAVYVTNNTLPQTYFPASYPGDNNFKLIVSGNRYTSDTTYNTAPDDYGNYNDLNMFNVRSGYSLAAGTVKKLIPSWTGRIVKLKSSNLFYVRNENNIRLRGGNAAAVPQNQSISLRYDGSTWNEVERTF